MKEDIAKKHEHCQMSVRWKSIKGTQIPRPGLFCQEHDVYLDWLRPEVAYELIDSGQVVEELWRERKKTKPKNSDLGNVLKKRKKQRLKAKTLNTQHIKQTGRPL
jgi:hypothetical protein